MHSMSQQGLMVSSLPSPITYNICQCLSSLEIVNACTAISKWKWIIFTPRVQNLLRRHMNRSAWLDRRLCELTLKQTSLSADYICQMVRYHSMQTDLFDRNFSEFAPVMTMQTFYCLILGPAVDAIGFLDSFYTTLIRLMDTNSKGKLFSHPVGWTGNGISIRIPVEGNTTSGDLLIEVSTLHARFKADRERQSSRVKDSFIVTSGHLTRQASSMIEVNDFVFYLVDAPQSHTSWDEIRCELTAISRSLSSKQTLVVISVCAASSVEDKEFDCVSEIARNLGGADRGPLAAAATNWRVWCLKHTNSHYLNLNEIFQWTCFDIFFKRVQEHRQVLCNSTTFSSIWDMLSKWF